MKSAALRKQSFSSASSPPDRARLQQDFDDLVMRATHGDRSALGALAITLAPALLEEARSALGDFDQEAGDILQEFFLDLLEGRSRFTPAQGRALAWLCGVIRAMARRRRLECEERWGISQDL